jgi:mannan endo-1,4-beta-mannosidase
MKKCILFFICIMLLPVFLLSACTYAEEKSYSNNMSNDRSDPKISETQSDPIVRDMEYTEEQKTAEEIDKKPHIEILIEAEDAELSGGVRIEKKKAGFSGTGYVTGIETPSDTVSFVVQIPVSGAYDLNFISASYSGYKENNILLDGQFIGTAEIETADFNDSVLKKIYMEKGEHEIKMTKSWGWIYLDALRVTSSEPADPSLYKVTGSF